MIDFYVKDSCHTNIQVSTAVSFPVVHANMLIRISWLHFGSKSQVWLSSASAETWTSWVGMSFTDNSFVTNACSQFHQLKVNLEVHFQFKMKSIFISKFSSRTSPTHGSSQSNAPKFLRPVCHCAVLCPAAQSDRWAFDRFLRLLWGSRPSPSHAADQPYAYAGTPVEGPLRVPGLYQIAPKLPGHPTVSPSTWPASIPWHVTLLGIDVGLWNLVRFYFRSGLHKARARRSGRAIRSPMAKSMQLRHACLGHWHVSYTAATWIEEHKNSLMMKSW